MVIDLANSPSFEDKAVLEFFWNSGSKLLAARYPSSEPTGRPITAISAPRSPMRNWSRPPGIPHTIIRSTRFPEFFRGIAASSPGENRVRISPGLAADDVAGKALCRHYRPIELPRQSIWRGYLLSVDGRRLTLLRCGGGWHCSANPWGRSMKDPTMESILRTIREIWEREEKQSGATFTSSARSVRCPIAPRKFAAPDRCRAG